MSDDTENEAFLKTPAGLLLVKEIASGLKLLVFALIAKVPNLIEGKDVDLIVQLLAALVAGGVVALWTYAQHPLMEKHVDAKVVTAKIDIANKTLDEVAAYGGQSRAIDIVRSAIPLQPPLMVERRPGDP